MKAGPDIARVAALIGDPARANMLSALMSGRALTASELAAEAGIAPPTASSHLAKLEQGAIQTLINRMEKREVALALKGANEQVKESFFSNMSARAGKMMREDMEAMGPVRLKDVDEAQSRMVATAKDLAARGEIIIQKTKANEEMIA